MLSVLIPARNEFLLKATIESTLSASRGDIEIIAVLDGYWPEPNIIDDPRVTLIHHTEPIGQRQAINEATRIAKGKYILKTDAHSMFDEGFDVKLAADCEYDWTVIPRMYNLHAFDHVCKNGHRFYQDKFDYEKENVCPDCKEPVKVEMVWKPRKHRKTDYMNFSHDLVVKYWKKYGKRPEAQGDITDVLNGVGACWFMHKDRFWELGGMDEKHGSWGQMGVEVAMKAWLSGGRHVVNKKTWFAHMFRTTGEFGFPYKISGKSQDKARAYSQDLWQGNNWPNQKRDFQWLLDKFAPIPDWETDTTIIYITDNSVSDEISDVVRKTLTEAANGKPIISVSQKPIDFGENICVGDIGRSHLSLFSQLLAGAEAAKTKYIAIAEHDCLYTKEHFNFRPPKDDVFYYNLSQRFVQWGKWREGQYSHHRRRVLSNLVCGRKIMIKAIQERVDMLKAGRIPKKGQGGVCEPGICDNKIFKDLGKDPTSWTASTFRTKYVNLDIRHKSNFSGRRQGQRKCYWLPYWGSFYKVMGKVPECKIYQKNRKGKFRGKGKWDNFIKPLLPFDDYKDRTFVDVGCAEGMYLKKAKRLGFGKIVGFDEREDAVKYAAWDYGNVLHKRVDDNFDWDNIPVADVTLLSCFHYWLEEGVLQRFIDKLAEKSLYIIVVGTEEKHSTHTSLSDSKTAKSVFKDWELVKSIENIDSTNDPAPRRMYSLLFKSRKLVSLRTDIVCHNQPFNSNGRPYGTFADSYRKYIQDVFKDIPIKTTSHDYYKHLQRMKKDRENIKVAKRFRDLANSVKNEGLIEPLPIRSDGKLSDGDHRIIVLDELKRKYVICKVA